MSPSRPKIQIQEKTILCPHCHAKNPVKAYCCISCYKVIHGEGKGGFLHNLQKNRLFLLASILFCLSSAIFIRKWLSSVEHHMDTIQSETRHYYKSMQIYQKETAEKTDDSGWVSTRASAADSVTE